MFATRFTLLLAVASLALPAYAQSGTTIDDLDAERLNSTQITIDFEYDGSACEEVGKAEVGEVTHGVLAVTFPTSTTGDVCTMQMVEIEVEQAVDADASVTGVEVTLLTPEGEVAGTETAQVEDG